ncbi:unnamed protein product, partial [Urochloa humidicola]
LPFHFSLARTTIETLSPSQRSSQPIHTRRRKGRRRRRRPVAPFLRLRRAASRGARDGRPSTRTDPRHARTGSLQGRRQAASRDARQSLPSPATSGLQGRRQALQLARIRKCEWPPARAASRDARDAARPFLRSLRRQVIPPQVLLPPRSAKVNGTSWWTCYLDFNLVSLHARIPWAVRLTCGGRINILLAPHTTIYLWSK